MQEMLETKALGHSSLARQFFCEKHKRYCYHSVVVGGSVVIPDQVKVLVIVNL